MIREIRVEIGEVRLRPGYGGGGNEGEGKGQRGRGLVEAVHLGTEEEGVEFNLGHSNLLMEDHPCKFR